MSDARAQPEPSIEEILATISRIIAEDKPAGGTTPAADSGDAEEALELTDAIGEDGTVRRLSPLQPLPPAAAEPSSASAQGQKSEGILSAAASSALATAFTQLGSAARERRREGETALGGGYRTLEDIVREILRPLLQAWLDEHLSGIVERLVREEMVRIVGEAGRH
jgi:cell pole-organizing protein PopZ